MIERLSNLSTTTTTSNYCVFLKAFMTSKIILVHTWLQNTQMHIEKHFNLQHHQQSPVEGSQEHVIT